jgi:tRNA U34 2-thiouridine synthase MnmA/TrmU
MRETGASFIVTGEVLGQRPMSQRRDAMRLIDKKAELDGLVLRPLSAQHLPETLPEKEGWVDRKRLLNMHGRSRKPQITLAEQFNIRDYPCPAGGCLLTDPGFARRMKDLMTHQPGFSLNDVHLLKVGRHFRLSPQLKLVVGRNEDENEKIQTFSRKDDFLFRMVDHPGPLSLLRGEADAEAIKMTAAITLRYSKAKDLGRAEVLCRRAREESGQVISASSAPEEKIKELMIGE